VFGTSQAITPSTLGQIGFNPNNTLFRYTGRQNFQGPQTIDFTGFQPNFLYNTGA
jgi:hypothetical protein